MPDIEEIKNNIYETLEFNFINNKDYIENQMKIFNILISSFSDVEEYSYDEFCKCKIKFEVESCDTLDIDFEEGELSDKEKVIIRNRAMRKKFADKNANYEELMIDEYVKWQLDKCLRIDKKMFYHINKYASIGILKNKIPKDIWKEKEKYFDNIFEKRALKLAEENAKENQSKHEEEIRASI